jgi:hypothetical protein
MPVAMTVVQIGVVGMPVHKLGVAMPVAMGLAGWIGRGMLVGMMSIVTMPVLVLHGIVSVLVIVPFGQVQPQPKAHQATRHQQPRR